MSDPEIVIALDAMGGDGAPGVVIRGANIARVRYPRLRFMFFGKQPSITAGLARFKKLKQVSTVHHAEAVIADNDKPVQALRRRQGSRSSSRSGRNWPPSQFLIGMLKPSLGR